MTPTQDSSYQRKTYAGIVFSCISERGHECTFHVRDHCLLYIRSGECEIIDRDEHTLIRSGECAFVRRHVSLLMKKRSLADGTPFQSIAFSFQRAFLMKAYRNLSRIPLPRDAHRSRANLVKLPMRPDVTSLFESLVPYFDTSLEPDEQWLQLKLTEGLQVVLRTGNDLYASLFDFAEPWKIDILDYLNENYMYELTLADMAHFTGRSLATFKRDFKKVSDLTPQKWIIRRRLQRAHELFTTGSHRVQDVMSDVGFTNPSYFSRIYKLAYGCLPSAS